MPAMSLGLSMKMRITPALLHLTRLLSLPVMSLHQAVRQELGENPALEDPATLAVTISREALDIIAGRASATEGVLVAAQEAITIEIVARRNCKAASPDKVENIPVPAPGKPASMVITSSTAYVSTPGNGVVTFAP